jgi:hypothetical protein
MRVSFVVWVLDFAHHPAHQWITAVMLLVIEPVHPLTPLPIPETDAYDTSIVRGAQLSVAAQGSAALATRE